jgi:hypothetical protein
VIDFFFSHLTTTIETGIFSHVYNSKPFANTSQKVAGHGGPGGEEDDDDDDYVHHIDLTADAHYQKKPF